MFSTVTSSSNFFLSVQAVGNFESASAAWFLVPARRTILNLKSDKRRYHQVRFPEASDIISSHVRASWSVLTVDQSSF